MGDLDLLKDIGTDLSLLNPDELVKLLRPLPESVWACDFPMWTLEEGLKRLATDMSKAVDVNYTPDFQRGHVWTPDQQLKFTEALVRKFIPPHLLVVQFNYPHWRDHTPDSDLPNEIQCIDGLQRITAIRKFMAGEIKPFGLHVDQLQRTTLSFHRMTRVVRIQMHAFTRKADLLQYYLDLNEGATPHAPEELSRVKAMLKSA
jgi:uncharacterized protein YndB with AHSA1/START domain